MGVSIAENKNPQRFSHQESERWTEFPLYLSFVYDDVCRSQQSILWLDMPTWDGTGNDLSPREQVKTTV